MFLIVEHDNNLKTTIADFFDGVRFLFDKINVEFRMKIVVLFISLCLFFSLISCASCDGENPSVLLTNNGTGKADIQIKTSGGNTENINNIEPGTSSDRRTFDRGDIEFTISIQGVNDDIVYVLQANDCNDYTVTINPDNTVASSGKER